jgi:hypothetical protein
MHRLHRTLLTLLVLAGWAAPLSAHQGPPYPILVDEMVGGRKISVWADPDVGVGTFYIYMDADRPGEAPTRIRLGVRPSDDRLPEAFSEAEPAKKNEAFQMVAKAAFDERGPWKIRFLFDGPRGQGEIGHEVEVTPPGLGKVAALFFLLPFLGLGLLWIKIVHKRRELSRASEDAEEAALSAS